MLKHLYFPNVLRDEDPIDGGTVGDTNTRVEAPVTTVGKEPVILKGGNTATLPKEIAESTFNIDEFEVEQLPPPKVTAKEEPKKEEVVAKEEPKKVAPIKPPEKKVVAPIAPVAGKKAPAPIIPPVKGATTERDYSGFSQEEATVLKQMSNPAFEFASKLIKQNKELAGLKNTTYLQHEKAYLLDPRYSEKQSELSYVRKESQYWQQQLVLLREGKEAREMVGWDNQGKMVFGNTIKPSIDNEELIRTAMNNCIQAAGTVESDLRSFPTQYKTQISNEIKAIDETNKQMFSWEQDAKLLDYELEVEGLGTRSIKQIKEDFKSMLPPWMQSHPLVNVCGNLMASLRIGQAYLAEAQKGGAVQQVIDDEKEHKEPTSKDKLPPTKDAKEVHGVKEFSLADLPQ